MSRVCYEVMKQKDPTAPTLETGDIQHDFSQPVVSAQTTYKLVAAKKSPNKVIPIKKTKPRGYQNDLIDNATNALNSTASWHESRSPL